MSQDTETVAPEVASPSSTAVYVYGVARGGGERLGKQITGVGPEPAPVRVVANSRIAALVSDVPQGWNAATRTDVEAHDRVLAELMDERTTVPMRFGVVLQSDEAVRERVLARHSDELEALLERLDGREQMSVKAYYLEEALLRAVLLRRPDLKERADALEGLPLARSQEGRIALGREVADEVEQQRRLDERALADPLVELADDAQIEPSVSERHVASVHVLVARGRRAELDAAVQRLADAHKDRFAVRYIGPLPPYSFSALELDPGPEPWG